MDGSTEKKKTEPGLRYSPIKKTHIPKSNTPKLQTLQNNF